MQTQSLTIGRATSLTIERGLAVVAFALLTALGAQVSIPLPGGVPMSLQTLAVGVCAVTLGGALGAASMTLYLLAGVVGLPVFAEQQSGAGVAFGLTGGYLLGFLLAQAVGARVARGERITWHRLFFAALAVHAIVFAVGVPWLKAASGSSWGFALLHGLWIFVPGTLIKCGLIAFAGAPLRRLSITRGWLRAGDSDRAAS